MNPRRKKRLTIIISLLVGLSVITGLILYALSQNIDLFYKPSEVHFGKQETGIKPTQGQRLRIGGIVVPGSVNRNTETLEVSFKLTDMKMPLVFSESDPMVTVTYKGILPDLFREEQGIVANGVLSENLVIEATEVLAKHDENYMPKEITDGMSNLEDNKGLSEVKY